MSDAGKGGGTVVLQSQRPERLAGWEGRCTASVAAWAQRHGFAYRCEDDVLFDRVPTALRSRLGEQAVVLADLARLYGLRALLEEGFARAIWVDADVLIFRDFLPPGDGDHVGRECWVQPSGPALRVYRKVHNAWLQFGAASVFLPWYIDRAEALLQRVDLPVVPQFIGPKLLTAWHNIAPFPVEERVGMLSPLCLQGLLGNAREPAPALERLVASHRLPLCALNLCASLEERRVDGCVHDRAAFHRVIDGLLDGSLVRYLDDLRAPLASGQAP